MDNSVDFCGFVSSIFVATRHTCCMASGGTSDIKEVLCSQLQQQLQAMQGEILVHATHRAEKLTAWRQVIPWKDLMCEQQFALHITVKTRNAEFNRRRCGKGGHDDTL